MADTSASAAPAAPGQPAPTAADTVQGNDLLLYYHAYSFYSQKVVMALHEKNLPFKSQSVNLTKGEQYDPWFLQINPKGEVPVLRDGVRIIPDSSRILDYLEDNFSNGGVPRLTPNDLGGRVKDKVVYFRNVIDLLPAGVITMGSFFHPEFTKNPKLPFIKPVRTILMNAENNSTKNLQEKAKQNPEYSNILLEKAEKQALKHQSIISHEEYLKVIKRVEVVLNNVEKELYGHNEKENTWLACQRFTSADISLTILLERLYRLGLSDYFWEGKRPNVKEYYLRVQKREFYKKTIPSTLFHLQTLIKFQSLFQIGVGIFTTVAIIAGGLFYYRRFKLR